jgi:histidinol-phosphatase
MVEPNLSLALATARRAVVAASAASMTHFRRGMSVEFEPAQTVVTAADRDAEAAILRIVQEVFPDHAVLGEEAGEHAGAPETRWIIHPIDGTREFTRGGSFWGPLLGLEHQGEIVAGAMALPALGETYWAARGMSSWLQRGTEAPVPLHVSGVEGAGGRFTDFTGRPTIASGNCIASNGRVHEHLLRELG